MLFPAPREPQPARTKRFCSRCSTRSTCLVGFPEFSAHKGASLLVLQRFRAPGGGGGQGAGAALEPQQRRQACWPSLGSQSSATSSWGAACWPRLVCVPCAVLHRADSCTSRGRERWKEKRGLQSGEGAGRGAEKKGHRALVQLGSAVCIAGT